MMPFSNYPGITAAQIMPVLLPPDIDRIIFMEDIKSQGIQTSIHYSAIHKFTAHRRIAEQDEKLLPVTENVSKRKVPLSLYAGITDKDISIIFESISNFYWDPQGIQLKGVTMELKEVIAVAGFGFSSVESF